MAMSRDGYHIMIDCRKHSELLRAKGFSFDQIADIFTLYHDVSPLKLHRYAHGLTGAQAVAAYNDLDPAGTAAMRVPRLYVFEGWPDSERRPNARALTIFAQIYHTTARRLVTDEMYASYSPNDRDLIDRTDHRHLDSQGSRHAPGTVATRASMELEAVRASGTVPAALTPAGCAALLRALRAEEADVKRRDLLFELALAMGGAPALVLLRHLSPPEKDRLATAVRTSGRVDAGTVEVIEKLTARCRRLDDDFGPETVLPVVDAQRELVAGLLRGETLLPALRDRLTYAYAQLSQLAGYLQYDLMDYAGAQRRYREALGAAHQIADPTLITYLHTCLSNIFLRQGQTGRALDHIYAAEGWARRSPSALLRSLHAIDMARALARSGSVRESEHALARSRQLVSQPRSEADPSYLYWWTPIGVQRNTAYCMLAWGRLTDAIDSAEQALAIPMTRKIAHGEALLYYAEALTRKREIPAAVDKIRGAAHLAGSHSSGQLTDSVRQARTRLQPWAGNKHVRHLDEELRSLSIVSQIKE
ncbi:hypothetical protein OG884_03030 [Streptosporangium sp. NBC_01755]|uniref:hypothetical protein n=2 Tax=unclassified Streptosporangium TaxID=2632669 RepID=UPI002DDC6F9E|nr:hypothetical protein [Streptosporangium sp. NBC_01755]WSD00929.1 hypothetical protein OG884_03030 [Streptosporangium sp. NBC_01755]